MIPHAGAARLSARAGDVLREVFATVQADFAFRLWDGALVPFGAGPPAFTVVIRAPGTFLRLMRDPTPLAFGEAYVSSAIDIEGDLFAAMRLANSIEDLRVSFVDRIRILFALVRG